MNSRADSSEPACIAVRFHSGGWRIEADELDDELCFGRLLDAERVALSLSRRRGHAVRLFDREGRLTATYRVPRGPRR